MSACNGANTLQPHHSRHSFIFTECLSAQLLIAGIHRRADSDPKQLDYRGAAEAPHLRFRKNKAQKRGLY